MGGLSIETMPRWVLVVLGLMLLLAAAGEVFLTGLLVEHVPWLGWPLTILTVAAVVYAVVVRLRRKAKPAGPPPPDQAQAAAAGPDAQGEIRRPGDRD